MKTNREIRSRNENYINKGLTTFPKTMVRKEIIQLLSTIKGMTILNEYIRINKKII